MSLCVQLDSLCYMLYKVTMVAEVNLPKHCTPQSVRSDAPLLFLFLQLVGKYMCFQREWDKTLDLQTCVASEPSGFSMSHIQTRQNYQRGSEITPQLSQPVSVSITKLNNLWQYNGLVKTFSVYLCLFQATPCSHRHTLCVCVKHTASGRTRKTQILADMLRHDVAECLLRVPAADKQNLSEDVDIENKLHLTRDLHFIYSNAKGMVFMGDLYFNPW